MKALFIFLMLNLPLMAQNSAFDKLYDLYSSKKYFKFISQFKEVEKVDIEQIFRLGVEDLVDFASFKNIEFRFTIEDIFEIEMNRSLSQILVNNLLKNAIVHGDGGKTIEIVIEANRFSVCNQSQGTPLDTYKIFDRFYLEDL